MRSKTTLVSALITAAVLTGSMRGTARTNRSVIVTRVPASGANYVARLGKAISWSEFPLRVYFVRDANFSAANEEEALRGFDRWVAVTDRLVRYEVVNSPDRAQVVVKFDAATDDGYTTTHYTSRGHIFKADMNLGIRHGRPVDVTFVAAHEFGHALGIDGHSDDKDDLMYPVHCSGTAAHITERDLNTLATAYPVIAKRITLSSVHTAGSSQTDRRLGEVLASTNHG